jgi:hypothetical protein
MRLVVAIRSRLGTLILRDPPLISWPEMIVIAKSGVG